MLAVGNVTHWKDGPRPRPNLSVVTTASLQAELRRRLAKLGDLIAQRDALDKRISKLHGTAKQAPGAPFRFYEAYWWPRGLVRAVLTDGLVPCELPTVVP
jgi:hypothetical protein